MELDNALENANAIDERKSLHKQRFPSVEHEDVIAALQGLMSVYGDDYEGLYEAISPHVDRFPGHHAFNTQVALVAEQAGHKNIALTRYQSLLETTPNDPDLLRAIRRVYLSRQNYDAAWCLCRTLDSLGGGEPR